MMLAHLRVLVVVDDLMDQLAVRRAVLETALPYELTMTSSLTEAKEALGTSTFDVIVTDHTLADGCAIDVLAGAGDVASVIMTSGSDHGSGPLAGTSDYLVREANHEHLRGLSFAVDRAVRLKEHNRRLATLVHALTHIGDAVSVSGAGDTIQFVNRAFCELYGWTETEVLGRASQALWAECMQPEARGSDELSTHVTLTTKDGRALRIALTRSPIHDATGDVIAIVRVMRDVTEHDRVARALHDANVALERSLATIEKLAVRDGLTGLFNRRELHHRLTMEASHAARSKRPLTLVLFDIDHFKSINDRFGHAAGDAVLRRVSWIVEDDRRGLDSAARYGGDAFALMLPAMSPEDAEKVASRLRDRLEAELFDLGDGIFIPVTASFGVASVPTDATTLADLLTAAEEALYEAKITGRNRVVSRPMLDHAA